jgi:hypothetical protein
VWSEYGLVHTEAGKQGKLSYTAYRFKDLTGALAAWEWQRSPEGKPCDQAAYCTQDGARTIVFQDNYLLVFNRPNPPKPAMDAVIAALPGKTDTELPAILTFIPRQGLVPDSARYVLGKESLSAFAPELAGTDPGFAQGAEAQVAQYKLDDQSPVHLAIFYYATPERARLRRSKRCTGRYPPQPRGIRSQNHLERHASATSHQAVVPPAPKHHLRQHRRFADRSDGRFVLRWNAPVPEKVRAVGSRRGHDDTPPDLIGVFDNLLKTSELVRASQSFPQSFPIFSTDGGKLAGSANPLCNWTYGPSPKREKWSLTSPPLGPTLQSQTGFDGCDTVGSDSPIKRNLLHVGGLETGEMPIRENGHFFFPGSSR